MTATLGDHLVFSTGSSAPRSAPRGRFRVYGANGAIGYCNESNAAGPLIVLGRVGAQCGSLRYCDSDVWVTENAVVCRAKDPRETRYWYYALQTCRLGDHRCGSGQPLLSQRVLRDVAVRSVEAPRRRAIAELLGSLDDKISANARVIDTAEDVMVAIAQAAPERVPLSALASRSTGLLNVAEFDDAVAHYSLAAFDDRATPRVVPSASIRSGKFLLSGPCVLFARLNPRIPRIWNVVGVPSEMALASSEFVVLIPSGVDASALWAALRQPDVSERLQRRVAGTSGSHQRIPPSELLDVPVPDVRRLPTAARRTITGLGALCHARRAESERLSALRDALLPVLISGELSVRSPR
ncbi:restriction endonuclease subunit S [Mycobacterium sp. E342]|uniref:restriction endonuclease subunit S n=1 Tax=Mycobacterium sp. E342 TaxID=1834147 RepID=UPI0007FB7A09|nr:restriction endonuclease subunit S [Mycobacterium sp. E342]OBH26671.1 restriction endonuclease subunit S [Mycobacterium sp. E342]